MRDDDAQGPGRRHHTVTTADGASLAVQVQGPPGGAAPLLLLPGQANSHAWWDGLREPFSEDRPTITFDYRGTGATRAPLGDWSTASFAEDALAVIDHLGLPTVDVYGTSMGGRVAQHLAIDHPGRVARLVLACTTPGGPQAVERSQDARRALAQTDDGARRAALIALMYTPAWPHGERSTLLGDPTMTPQAQLRHLRASGRHDASAGLPRIVAPTLVLHGEEDRMAPVENAHLLAGRIPDARLVLTPGGRHGFFDEFAASVGRDVLAFLG